jgi:hypothetical protein
MTSTTKMTAAAGRGRRRTPAIPRHFHSAAGGDHCNGRSDRYDRSAQANQAARSAASQTLSGIARDANEVRATRSAVTGRVLSFDLTSKQPRAVVQRVMDSTLGVDLCP